MQRLMHKLSIGLLAGMLWAAPAAATAEDCTLGERYRNLAQDRIAAFKEDEAIFFLEQAVRYCPSYEANQQLGELAAGSPEAADKRRAVTAFVAAHALADTDAKRARTLYQYGRLLNREGDPQNAYPLLMNAQALAPANTELTALLNEVRPQIDNPTQAQVVRGLSDSLYQPLILTGIAGVGMETGASEPTAAPPAWTGPSANIPINFITASTRVDEQTRTNVRTLAQALNDPTLRARQFVFVGHADARGDSAYNLELSRQRAEAIRQSVVLLEPELEGRIDIVGRGAYEPIAYENNEQAWRANRRLQVLLQ